MEILIIGIVAAVASLLTFFSGFGLGTLLTPVFVLFFPVEIAIALTGIVHLLNNLFKGILIGNHASKELVLKFGIPAVLGAFAGAWLLTRLEHGSILYSYQMGGKAHIISTLKIVIAILMVFFAMFELVPRLKNIQFSKNKLVFGGLLSGFFGGLSGHQGALRSAFLLRYGLTKETFLATGIIIAIFIDITRLSVYFRNFEYIHLQENIPVLAVAVACAFAGAFIGSKLLKKVTMDAVQVIVAVGIILLSVALGTGLI